MSQSAILLFSFSVERAKEQQQGASMSRERCLCLVLFSADWQEDTAQHMLFTLEKQNETDFTLN